MQSLSFPLLLPCPPLTAMPPCHDRFLLPWNYKPIYSFFPKSLSVMVRYYATVSHGKIQECETAQMSYLSHCCVKYQRKEASKKGFILPYGLRHFHHNKEDAAAGEAAGHTLCRQESGREKCGSSACSSLFSSEGGSSPWNGVTHTLGGLFHLNTIQEFSNICCPDICFQGNPDSHHNWKELGHTIWIRICVMMTHTELDIHCNTHLAMGLLST